MGIKKKKASPQLAFFGLVSKIVHNLQDHLLKQKIKKKELNLTNFQKYRQKDKRWESAENTSMIDRTIVMKCVRTTVTDSHANSGGGYIFLFRWSNVFGLVSDLFEM